VINRVEIDAEPLGTVGLSGPGAGGAATSSAVLGDLVAVARGLSSTWAGLPPAAGSSQADAALDPTSGSRDWFAFVPGTADEVRAGSRPVTAPQVVATARGLAVRVGGATLDQARATVRPYLAPGTDATLYPVDD
jgi:hypothetical protein